MKNPNDYDNTHSTYTNNLNHSEVITVFGRRSCSLNQDIIAVLYINRDKMNARKELGLQLFYEFLYMCGNIDDDVYYSIRTCAGGNKWKIIQDTCP